MKSIREIAADPNFVKGIYNYCDRWCEKCPFTSKCANFALNEDRFGDTENRDLNNKEFWNKLSSIFKETLEMIREDAERLKIDLDNLDKVEFQPMKDNENHYLIQLCLQYEKYAKAWFEEPVYIELESTKSKKIELADAFEIINWYMFFIGVKFRRALSVSPDDDEEFRFIETNGTAKVALIGIDRSLLSWNILVQHLPKSKYLLEIISILSKIKLVAENQFPNARNFIRPALDE